MYIIINSLNKLFDYSEKWKSFYIESQKAHIFHTLIFINFKQDNFFFYFVLLVFLWIIKTNGELIYYDSKIFLIYYERIIFLVFYIFEKK